MELRFLQIGITTLPILRIVIQDQHSISIAPKFTNIYPTFYDVVKQSKMFVIN